MSANSTMRTWTSVIKSVDDIPEIFINTFKSLVNIDGPFPYTLLVPPGRRSRVKNNAILVSVIDYKLFILEKDKKNVKTKCYNFKDINYIESGSILLSAWFNVSGFSDGILTKTVVEFNSVGELLFKNIEEVIRISVNGINQQEEFSDQLGKLDYLTSLNFKFMNYARTAVKSGEKIINIMLQPGIYKKTLQVFGKVFYKAVSSAHLTVLTDKELIIIKDSDDKSTKCGGIKFYIPLDRINEIAFKLDEKSDLLLLKINLHGNDFLELNFEAANKSNLETLIAEYNNLKACLQP